MATTARQAWRLLGTLVWVLPVISNALVTTGARAVDFSRDVLPILAEHCLKCHGPDGHTRRADLRLDRPVGSEFDTAELRRRLLSEDQQERMPPPEAMTRLSQRDRAILVQWADAGAPWSQHWSLRPIRHPELPPSADDRPSSPPADSAIDRFVEFRRAAQRSSPSYPAAPPPSGSQRASRHDLIRRVSYSLTGLPPTVDEIQQFINDRRPEAYGRMVDRYLASPRYGEHMARFWLDLARYADTNGYHVDNHREMWRWREWVIEAWNCNMPFDRFTIEQLAGDQLPNTTDQTRLASGFHRNTMVMFENGALPEEFLPEYVADRVSTTGTVWLGQTLQCARCHDHKYEPISQRDYYRFFAYFNNVAECGLGGQDEPAKPYDHFPTRLQQQDLDHNERQIAAQLAIQQARSEWAETHPEAWQPTLAKAARPLPPKDATIYLSFDEKDGSELLRDGKPVGKVLGTAVRLPQAKSNSGLLLTNKTSLRLDAVRQPAPSEAWTLATWLYRTTDDEMVLFRHRGASLVADGGVGLEVRLVEGKLHVVIAGDAVDPWIARSSQPTAKNSWQHVCIRYDAQGGRVDLRLGGEAVEVEQPTGRPPTYSPTLTVASLSDSRQPMRGMLDEFRVYYRYLSDEELEWLRGADPVAELLAIPPEDRSETEQRDLAKFYLRRLDSAFREATEQLVQLRRIRQDILRDVPTSMVMKERTERRPTYILERGDYQRPGEEVLPGIPRQLGGTLPEQGPGEVSSRLDLARWIASADNPLTARVFVNHAWRMHFGRGIVETPGDFGTRGEPPTHPQLLDWLAAEFIESGWDVKRLHRSILMSATFQQTSRVSLEKFNSDPENIWLSRGPRFRLSAEQIRDTALAAAGLLESRMGGASVSPYQPAGLWKELSYNPTDYSAQVFRQSHGADLYRRSLYTFWKRSVPPPNMVAFGAPTRETCIVKRSRSETPLQALVLMNDPTFVEASRVLAAGLIARETDQTQRLTRLWLTTMSRPPSDAEQAAALRSLHELRETYRADSEAADQLLSVGEYPLTLELTLEGSDDADGARTRAVAELAAWTCLCSVVLQQNEVLTQH